MSSKDERIVNMKFNNEKFHKGVKETLNDLKNLKKGLNLEGASKGLTNLEKSASSFSLDGIGKGVDTIASRFTNLGIIGVAALQNITNRAIDAGARIVSALTLEPVSLGFQEYELKMGSIQTIMAGTGRSLEDVNDMLAKLNKYSDQTVYSFQDMTSSIGKFTNAGVSLEDAEGAIRGISNWAAISGVGAQGASMAMYNLSQAMSMDKLTLLDWRSIENADMATMQFKQNIIDTGLELGTLTKVEGGRYATLEGGIFDAKKGFRDMLNEGWITGEVLNKTLNKYADVNNEIGKAAQAAATEVRSVSMLMDTMTEFVQSGWTMSWESIIGDKDQSVELLSGISKGFEQIMGPSIEARNAMLSFWNAEDEAGRSGRKDVIQGIANTIEFLGEVLKPVRDAFREVFPPMTGERLVELSAQFKALTETFKMEEITADNLKQSFKGLFTVVKLFGKSIGFMFDLLKPGFKTLATFGSLVLETFARWSEAVMEFDETYSISESYIALFENLNTAVQDFLNSLRVKTPDMTWLSGMAETLNLSKFHIEDFGFSLDDLNDKLANMIPKGLIKFRDILVSIKDKVVGTAKGVKNFLAPIIEDLGKTLEGATFTDFLGTGMIVGSGGIIIALFKKIHNLTDNFDDMLEGVADSLEGVGKVLKSYSREINSKALKNIAISVGILAAALIALTFVDPDRLSAGLLGVSILLGEVIAAIAILDKLTFKGVTGAALTILILSGAIYILAKALVKLKDFQTWDETWPALVSMAALIGGLVFVVKMMKGVGGKDMITGAIGIFVFAAAVGKLSKSIKVFAGMEPGEIVKGLLALGGVLAGLSAFMKFSKIGKLKKQAATIAAIAISVLLLYTSVRLFGVLDTGVLAQGLLSIAAVIGALAVAIRIMGSANGVKAASTITAMAVSLILLLVPIKLLGNMDTEKLKKGIISVIILIGALAGAMALMGALTTGGGLLASAAALIGISIALTILSVAILALSQLSWKSLAIGLAAIIVPLIAITAAATFLAPLAAGLLAAAVSFLIFGVAAIAISAGLMLLATAFAAIIAVGTAGAAIFAEMVSIIAIAIATLIPQALAALMTSIKVAAPVIAEGIIVMLTEIVNIITVMTPIIVESLLVILLAVVELFVEYQPKFIKAGADFIIGLIRGFADNVPRFVDEGIKAIIAFLNGMADAINNNQDELVEAIHDAMIAVISLIFAILFEAMPSLLEIGALLITSLGRGAKSMFSSLRTIFSDAGDAGADELAGKDGEFESVGTRMMKSIGMGMVNGVDWIIRKMGGEGLKIKKEMEKNMTMDEKAAWLAAWEVGEAKKNYWENYSENIGNNISKTVEATAAHVGGELDFGNPEMNIVTNLDDITSDVESLKAEIRSMSNIGGNIKVPDVNIPEKSNVGDSVKKAFDDAIKGSGLLDPVAGSVKVDVYNGDTGLKMDEFMAELERQSNLED